MILFLPNNFYSVLDLVNGEVSNLAFREKSKLSIFSKESKLPCPLLKGYFVLVPPKSSRA